MKFDSISVAWLHEKIATTEGADEFVLFMDGLMEPRFTLKQANIKKQDLSYWKREGLFENRPGAEGREWTRFGFFDYMWLRLVVELRKVHVPVKIIAQLRRDLFEIDDQVLAKMIRQDVDWSKENQMPSEMVHQFEQEYSKQPEVFLTLFKRYFSVFACLILGIMLDRSRLNLIITADGSISFFTPDKLNATENYEQFTMLSDLPHISVPLHQLLDEFYCNPFIAPKECQRVFGLTASELKIFEAIRKEGTLEVRIKLKPDKGGYLLMETIHQEDPKKSLHLIEQIIKKGGYQHIEIKTEQGAIRVCEIATKQKI